MKEASARDEARGHVFGMVTSRGVKHRQVWPKRDGMIGDFVTAELQCIKADIDEQYVDVMLSRKVGECLGQVAREQRNVADIFERPSEVFEDEFVVLNRKNDSHQVGNWREFGIAKYPRRPGIPL